MLRHHAYRSSKSAATISNDPASSTSWPCRWRRCTSRRLASSCTAAARPSTGCKSSWAGAGLRQRAARDRQRFAGRGRDDAPPARSTRELTMALLRAGVDALGLSGVDRGLLRVEPWGENMGRVGRIVNVRADVLLGPVRAGRGARRLPDFAGAGRALTTSTPITRQGPSPRAARRSRHPSSPTCPA